jgi:3-hydroxypropanoate dehydrogenase
MPALSADAFDQLFRQARTYNAFSGEVDDATIERLYDLVKWGPTTANTCPARFVFVKSAEAKAKLAPALDEGNRAKTLAAPCVVIVAYDLDFFEKLPVLFPHTDAKELVRWQIRQRAGDRVPAQRQPAGCLPDPGGARAGPGLRADVRLRQRPGGRGRSSPAPAGVRTSWSTWARAIRPRIFARSPRLSFAEACRIE